MMERSRVRDSVHFHDARNQVSRRGFLGASTGAAAAVANPGLAAAQSAGVKPADLPDLTIKTVRTEHLNTVDFQVSFSARHCAPRAVQSLFIGNLICEPLALHFRTHVVHGFLQ